MSDEINLIQITGGSTDLLGTRDIEGLLIHDHGQQVVGPDRYSVAANATDDAIGVLQQRGLAVEVIFSAADLAAHFATLDAESGNKDPGVA
jgi:hypothetical protein